MNKQENRDETRAKKYLLSLEHTEIEYEPLGNVTPDFLLDKKIAVEVRRLNSNHINNEHIISIENFEIPLIKYIKKIISTFEYKYYSNSTSIAITISKPLEIQNKTYIIKKIKRILKKHTYNISKTKSYTISDYLILTFTPIDKKNKPYFFTGCNNNFFWVVDELHKNIQLVIDEKDKKIDKNFHIYDEWWLILVDSIIYGLDSEDFRQLKSIKLEKQKFNKIIILSPKGNFKAFEF
ncbi:MAG: hypothetical protein L3J10_09740 [Sulfurimonas sp.]|nr:hypothetical protein [Sulfurimonas sp.]